MIHNITFLKDGEAEGFRQLVNARHLDISVDGARFTYTDDGLIPVVERLLSRYPANAYYICDTYPPRPWGIKWHYTTKAYVTEFEWFETEEERLAWVKSMARKHHDRFVVDEWLYSPEIKIPDQPQSHGIWKPDQRPVLTRDYKSGKCDW